MLRIDYKSRMGDLAILMLILSSGATFFTILNVQITLYALLVIAVLCAVVCGLNCNVLKRNAIVLFLITVVIFANGIVNSEYFVLNKDMIILYLRLISLFLIQSSISKDTYIRKYVQIMYILSIVSLVCFAYTMLIDYHLPFYSETTRNGARYFYTFYHTIGYRTLYQRNAGIFWEGPAYAVFLELAIVFAVTKHQVFDSKKLIKYLVVFSITLGTTLSTYAFISMGLLALLMFFTFKKTPNEFKREDREREHKRMSRILAVGCILMVCVLIYVEERYGLIQHKLFDRAGSFTTRFNDTYYTLELAAKRILTGYGIFNDHTVDALRNFGVVNNSNGLAVLLLAVGLPAVLLAAVVTMRSFKKNLELKPMQMIIVAMQLFLIYFSEHIWLFTLFLSFLFTWRSDERIASNEYHEMQEV